MRIGLISDTHIPDVAKTLPEEIAEAFRGVDLILHAGDIYISSVLDYLERIAPVLAARGDDDILRDGRVKLNHILHLDGLRLWLVHQRYYYIMIASSQDRNSPGKNEGDSHDIVVFGHEHRTHVSRSSGVLFINPGSPTFLHHCQGLGTVGILTIDSGKADVQILQL